MVALLNPDVPELQDAISAERQQLARNVKAHRQLLGLTQTDFAERVGKTQAFVSLIESGGCDPRFETLVRVAVALETTVSKLTNSEKISDPAA